MSINELSRVSDLLNPCRFGDAVRQQAYTQAQLADVGPPGGQLRFSLPNNITLDLSNAYVDFDLVAINETAEVPFILTIIRQGAAPTDGTWQLLYAGSSIGGVDIGRISFTGGTPFGPLAGGPANPPNTVIDILNAYFRFYGKGFSAALAAGGGTATDSFATSGQLNISISGFSYNDEVPSGWAVTSALISAAGPPQIPVFLKVTGTQMGVLKTPRVEKSSPLFNRVYVQVNGTTVFDVQNANRLYSALNFIDRQFDGPGKFVEDAYSENGTVINGRRKLRFFLGWVDLFQSIFPMDILPNAQIILYMDLELPNLALICSNATNSANQSYRIQNAKIKYHTLILGDKDKNTLRNELQTGITIPFLNWVYFADVLGPGSVNKQSIFNPSLSNLLGVLFVMVDQNYYADASHKRKLNTFLRNNINTYRLKVGNFYFPQDKVECSNNYYSLCEQYRELIFLAQIINRNNIIDDMELFKNFSGTTLGTGGNLIGNEPTDDSYAPWFDNVNNMMSVFGIATADIGFADKTHLCNRIALQGIDTSVLPNVVLELEGMSVRSATSGDPIDANASGCDLNIYSLSQDYITFYPDKFVWKH